MKWRYPRLCQALRNKDVPEVRPHKSGEQVSKHTPGPWTAEYGIRDQFHLPQYQRKDTSHVILGANDLPIAELRLGNIEANARLIAAAPEMLEMLKAALRAHKVGFLSQSLHDEFTKALEQAIAKATGGAE